MLVIRTEQMQAFAQARRQRFEDHCMDLLLNEWAEKYAGDDAARIRRELQALLHAGSNWGFSTERQRYRLVNVGAYLGLGFHHQAGYAWAVNLLADQSLAPEARLATLLHGHRPDGVWRD